MCNGEEGKIGEKGPGGVGGGNIFDQREKRKTHEVTRKYRPADSFCDEVTPQRK